MRSQRSLFALAALVALAGAGVTSSRPARADAAADLATARAFGVEGVALAEAGKCKEAIEKLSRAEALHHAPTTAERLGECEIATGQLVRGTERLNRVVREPLGPSAPPVFVAAAARAGKALEATLPRLATLRLTVMAPADADVHVTIDGEVESRAILGGDRPIDPGTHHIEVSAPGFFPARSDTAFVEGKALGVNLELKPDPNATAARAASASGETGDAAERGGRSRILPYSLFAVGGVGLAVGVAGAIIVSRKSSSLESACGPNKVCPTSESTDIRDAKAWATTSTIAFGVAGAAIVTGAVLLLTSGKSKEERPVARRVTPVVGVGSVGLTGVF